MRSGHPSSFREVRNWRGAAGEVPITCEVPGCVGMLIASNAPVNVAELGAGPKAAMARILGAVSLIR